MSKITDVSREEKKMLRSVFLRSFTLYTSVTPAKQGASGFCYSMIPFINRFYVQSCSFTRMLTADI